MNYKDFDKLNLKEKIKFFEENGINFIVKNTTENVYFKEKDDKILICFYDNERSDWAILNKLYDLGSNFYVDYTVVNANGEYDESADLIPIRKLTTKDILDYDDTENKHLKTTEALICLNDYITYFKEKMIKSEYYKKDLHKHAMENFIRDEINKISNEYTNLKLKNSNMAVCSVISSVIYDSDDNIHDTLFITGFIIKNVLIRDFKEYLDTNITKDSYEKKIFLSIDGSIIEE